MTVTPLEFDLSDTDSQRGIKAPSSENESTDDSKNDTQFAEAGPTDSVETIADDIAKLGAARAGDHAKTALTRIEAFLAGKTAADLLRPQLGNELAALLRSVSDDIARVLGDSVVAGQIAGVADVVSSVPVAQLQAGVGPPLPPVSSPTVDDLFGEGGLRVRFPIIEESVDIIQESRAFAGADFRQTAEAVKDGAFAVTGDLTEETVGSIRDALAKNLSADVIDPERFLSDVRGLFEEGTGLSDARINQVFRNTVGQAFSRGGERSLANPLVADAFPYRRYRPAFDSRLRPTHRKLATSGLNGTAIYRADDPIWLTFLPPWDFSCRCAWAPMTVKQAMQANVREAIDWWARAKSRKEQLGGIIEEHLEATKPTTPEFVPPPTLNGVLIRPSPEWVRPTPFSESQ